MENWSKRPNKVIKIDRDWRKIRSQFCTFKGVENCSSRTALFFSTDQFQENVRGKTAKNALILIPTVG